MRDYLNINKYRIKPIAEALISANLPTRFDFNKDDEDFSRFNNMKDSLPGVSYLMDSVYCNGQGSPLYMYWPGRVFVNKRPGVGNNDCIWLMYSKLSPEALQRLYPGFSFYSGNETPVGDFCWIWHMEDSWYLYSPRRNAFYENYPTLSDDLDSHESISDYWNQQEDTIRHMCRLLHRLNTGKRMHLGNSTLDGFFEVSHFVPEGGFLKNGSYVVDYAHTEALCGEINAWYPDFCPFEIEYYPNQYFDISALRRSNLHFYIFITEEAYRQKMKDVNLKMLKKGCYYSL